MNAVFPEDPFWTRPRVISGLIAAVYIVLAYGFSGGESSLRMALFCGLPLVCIWFPEFMGAHRPLLVWPRAVTGPSPPEAVAVAGWVLLAMPAVVLVISHMNQ